MTDNQDKNNQNEIEFKVVPFKHQRDLYMATRDVEYFAVLWEMGGGKSKLLLDTAAYLYKTGKITGLLIFAPKGAYMNWLIYEIPKHMSDSIDYRVSCYDAGGTRQSKQEVHTMLDKPDLKALDILLINTEAMSHKTGLDVANRFFSKHIVLTCVDESTDIKNAKALRTKNIVALRDKSKYRRIMTGTPITQSPLDLYSQCNFLKQNLLGHSSWFTFKNYYAIIMQMRMGMRQFPKVVGYRNLNELQDRLRAFSSRILKKDCLDLPEKIFMIRQIELGADQRRIYDSLRLTCVVELESGLVSVTNTLSMLVKLQEVICGHIRDADGKIHNVEGSRIEELLHIIEETQDKVIIWCNFVEDVRIISVKLREVYGEGSAEVYTGETNQIERMLAIDRFKTDPVCRFFISTSAGSKGLTLVESAFVIYYSLSYNLMTYLQSQDRNHRPGQRRDVTYVRFVARDTIDEKIVKALDNKEDLAKSILDNWRTILS